MALSQLKIRLNTSIPNGEYIDLTRDVLVYKGKNFSKFSKYPFFDPYYEYPKDKIQILPYDKRLEIFFLENYFRKTIINTDTNKKKKKEWLQKEIEMKNTEREKVSIEKQIKEFTQSLSALDDSMKQKLEKKISELRVQLESVEEKLRLLQFRFSSQSQNNLDFTVKMIFSTGFPSNFNSQSIALYDNEYSSSIFSIKGSNITWFPFLSNKYNKIFSYLKLNNEIYTVFQVILVNDIFNYPEYKDFIESFTDMSEKKDNNELMEWKQEVEKKLWDTLNDSLNRNDWTSLREVDSRSSNYQTISTYTDDYNQIFGPVSNPPSILSQFKIAQTDFYKSVRDIANTIDIDTIDTTKYKHLSNFFVQLKSLPTNPNVDSISKWKKQAITYLILVDLEQVVSNSSHKSLIQTLLGLFLDFKEKVKTFIRNYSTLSILTNNSNLYRVVSSINKLFIEERALQMTEEKNINYENEVFGEEIKKIVELKNKNYNLFSKVKESLQTKRKVNNPYWYTFLQEKDELDVNQFMTEILSCRNKKKCDKSIVNKLRVHLDELYTTNEKNTRTFEAVLMLNVIEGEINLSNYTRVTCSFSNKMIGNLMGQLKRQSDFHNVEDEKIFFSLKEELAKVKDIVQNQVKTQSKKTKSNTRSTKKKGSK
jgi:hypothetical protein